MEITPEIRAQVLRETAEQIRRNAIDVPDLSPSIDADVNLSLSSDIESEADGIDFTDGSQLQSFIAEVTRIAEREAESEIMDAIEEAKEVDSAEVIASVLDDLAVKAEMAIGYRTLAAVRP